MGVNSKCGVQSKRRRESHESCVCIVGFGYGAYEGVGNIAVFKKCNRVSEYVFTLVLSETGCVNFGAGRFLNLYLSI